MIQIPEQTNFSDWMCDLIRSRRDLVAIIPPLHEKDWHTSAMLLISANKDKLSRVALPLKGEFPKDEDWRRWAYFLIQSLSN